MKKTFKRLGAMFLAMVMAVSVLCTGAFADETYTITIKRDGVSGSMDIFSAYQIFAGTVHEDSNDKTKKTLSDITWGANVSEDGKTELLKFGKKSNEAPYTSPAELAATLTEENAKAFAAEAANYVTGTPYKNESGQNTISVPKSMAGYYLIKNDGTAGKEEAYTKFVLRVVGDTEFSPKVDVPTVEKKIVEGSEDKDSTTVGVNDTVNFKLTGTLPDNYADYNSYEYVFHDTLSEGLTLTDKQKSELFVKVYASKNEAEQDKDGSSNTVGTKLTAKDSEEASTGDYFVTVTPPAGDTKTTSLTVSFNNLKAIADPKITKDSIIVVYYSATLNSGAVISGNENKVHLEYSNNPNGEGTGNTTDKKVTVYTLQLDVVKVDGASKDENGNTYKTTLDGAKFILSKDKDLQSQLTDTNVNTDGSLKTNTLNDKLIAVKANTSPNYIVDDSGTAETKNYVMEVASSGSDKGKLNIQGLKPGETYCLYETKAPDGYNKLTAPVTIVIDANGNAKVNNTDLTTESHEIKTLYVENNAGSNLPSTGGMGTKLFYTIGGLLMAGAAIVLVIKKRRSSAE